MIELLRRQQRLVVGVLCVALPLIVYRVELRREGPLNPIDRLVLLLAMPLERALSRGVQLSSEFVFGYVDLRGAREQAVAVGRERDRLARRLAELEGLDAENARLRELLRLAARAPSLDLVPATVIALGGSSLDQVLRIDRGLGDGIERGMSVVSETGLVGRVVRVGFGFAEVQLITDDKVSLEVVLGRSRVRGRLRGGGLSPVQRLDVAQVLRTEDVRVGDEVLTSGLAGVYPRGIPVGRVRRVEPSPDGQELGIEVEPHTALARLEAVAVVRGGRAPGEPLATPDALLPPQLRPEAVGTSTIPFAPATHPLVWPGTTTTATRARGRP